MNRSKQLDIVEGVLVREEGRISVISYHIYI